MEMKGASEEGGVSPKRKKQRVKQEYATRGRYQNSRRLRKVRLNIYSLDSVQEREAEESKRGEKKKQALKSIL